MIDATRVCCALRCFPTLAQVTLSSRMLCFNWENLHKLYQGVKLLYKTRDALIDTEAQHKDLSQNQLQNGMCTYANTGAIGRSHSPAKKPQMKYGRRQPINPVVPFLKALTIEILHFIISKLMYIIFLNWLYLTCISLPTPLFSKNSTFASC